MELAVSSHHRRVGDTIIAAYFLGKGKKWSVRREAGKKEFYWNHQVGGLLLKRKYLQIVWKTAFGRNAVRGVSEGRRS